MRKNRAGFSLVEVVLSIAIISFAVVVLLGLLFIGEDTNHVSDDETQAAFLLTTLNADLSGSAPAAAGGSKLFGIVNTPYHTVGSVVTQTQGLATGAANASTYYFDNNQSEVGSGSTVPAAAHYRLTLVYVSAPAAGSASLAPTVARAIVSWPPQIAPQAGVVPAAANSIESLLSFPAP